MKSKQVIQDCKKFVDFVTAYMKTNYREQFKDKILMETIRDIAEQGFNKGYNSCSHAVGKALENVTDNF